MATIMERALTWPVMLPRVISGLFQVGDFPESGHDLLAAQMQQALFLHGTPGQVGILLNELLLNGGPMLEQEARTRGLDLV